MITMSDLEDSRRFDASVGSVGSFDTPTGETDDVETRRLGASVGSVGFPGGYPSVTDGTVVDDLKAWLGRFIYTMRDADLDVLTLWILHTHLIDVLYTTARMLLDSPVPGSGKTTTLEHIGHLALDPVQAASLSSPSLLTRMLADRMRTILIDEADRSLDPKIEGTGELLAIINSGYKRGATRPVLVPVKGGSWEAREMPTFGPVALAGNSPSIPDDTRSRTIRVLLLPDLEGRVEESDWELIEAGAEGLKQRIEAWADEVRDFVSTHRPPLPDGVIGRSRERWSPLKRVAVAAGGRWPAAVDTLALEDLQQQEQDREDGMVIDSPAVALLKDLHRVWGDDEAFIETRELLDRLIGHAPDMWGDDSSFGKALTAQRLGRMLAKGYGLNSSRQGDSGRGYFRAKLNPVWRRMGIVPSEKPTEPTEPSNRRVSDSSPTPPNETDGTDETAKPTGDRCGKHDIPKAGKNGECLACTFGSNDD